MGANGAYVAACSRGLSRSLPVSSLLALLLFVVLAGRLFLLLIGLVWLLQGAKHVLLQGLLFKNKAVFIPDEVWGLSVELVALHALLKQVEDVPVVGVSSEAERSAVLHVLLELVWLVQAQLVDGNLLLLALNIVIFFILAAAWETLPWQRTS